MTLMMLGMWNVYHLVDLQFPAAIKKNYRTIMMMSME